MCWCVDVLDTRKTVLIVRCVFHAIMKSWWSSSYSFSRSVQYRQISTCHVRVSAMGVCLRLYMWVCACVRLVCIRCTMSSQATGIRTITPARFSPFFLTPRCIPLTASKLYIHTSTQPHPHIHSPSPVQGNVISEMCCRRREMSHRKEVASDSKVIGIDYVLLDNVIHLCYQINLDVCWIVCVCVFVGYQKHVGITAPWNKSRFTITWVRRWDWLEFKSNSKNKIIDK